MFCYKGAESHSFVLFCFVIIGFLLGYGIVLMHLSSSLKIPSCGVSKKYPTNEMQFVLEFLWTLVPLTASSQGVNMGMWAIIYEVSILQRGSAAVACLWREPGSRALQGMAQGIIELLRSLLSSKQYFMCGKALWASWGEHRMTPGQQPLHKEQLHDET